MNRKPPAKVLKILREEVGFGCPIQSCGNPYLEWHHFDPKWGELNHHNPEGMIALCPEHHRKADANTYTKDQLRNFKKNKQSQVSGKFDWMRHDLVALVGGNFYLNTLTIFQFHGQKCIWFNRDKNGYLLLNIALIGEDEPIMKDNFWILNEKIKTVVSPPNGRMLEITYTNNDFLKIEFLEISSRNDLKNDFSQLSRCEIEYPITSVKIMYEATQEGISFNSSETTIKNRLKMTGCFFVNIGIAININGAEGGAIVIEE